MFKISIPVLLMGLLATSLFGQDMELYEQFNGRYDYTAIGNTLNIIENYGIDINDEDEMDDCAILDQSSATLNMPAGQTIEAAYLYWAGSGEGDFEVTLNNIAITASRTFSYELDATREFFAAFADVTTQVTAAGNGTYTFKDLDLDSVISANLDYCNSGTNFGGWAIIIIYEDLTLPLNQVNVYDGLPSVSQFDNSFDILLENVSVIDNEGAKIGFLAWEGDSLLDDNETLKINGNTLSNPPLNPANNAFNSTNTFTGANDLWNMDIDYYDIENNISVGDTEVLISATSNQDMVMVNNIITVLNSQLPDGTVEIDTFEGGETCGDREIDLEYTVHNTNCTGTLPEDTPIAFYAFQSLIGTAATINDIPIDGSETQNITLNVPGSVPATFDLIVAVDDTGDGTGVVNEIVEDNNTDTLEVHLLEFPEIPELADQEKCDVIGTEYFDLTESVPAINPDHDLSFHLSQEDADDNTNPIDDPENFENTENPQTIYVRVDNGECVSIDTFEVEVIDCPLPDGTIAIDNDLNACRGRDLQIDYTVSNIDATGPLPENTPIAFYVDGNLLTLDFTESEIPVGGSIEQTTYLTLGDNVPDVFDLLLVVDDIGNGDGVVEELDETNNTYATTVTFGSIPDIPPLEDLELCNEGFGLAYFDLTQQNEHITDDPNDEINYYTDYEDALEKTNPIDFPEEYHSTSDPQKIYVRLENEVCFTIAEFQLSTEDCPPFIPEGFSPNGDGINDVFEISGLLDIFLDHEILIYTRNGNLVFRGNNETGFWDGYSNAGFLFDGPVPTGVYFYVLNLNHPEYDVFTGWVYLNR